MKLSSTISCARAKISQAENGNLNREQLIAMLGIIDIKLRNLEKGVQEVEALHNRLGEIVGHVEIKSADIIEFKRDCIIGDDNDE